MAPSNSSAARKGKLDLTDRECELVAAAWLSSENPQIDWDKFAALAGFKNAHSARTCFGPIKKKLSEKYGNGKASAGVVKSYEWTPRPRKRKAIVTGVLLPQETPPAASASTDVVDLETTEDDEEGASAAAAEKQAKRRKAIDEANARSAAEYLEEDVPEGLV